MGKERLFESHSSRPDEVAKGSQNNYFAFNWFTTILNNLFGFFFIPK